MQAGLAKSCKIWQFFNCILYNFKTRQKELLQHYMRNKHEGAGGNQDWINHVQILRLTVANKQNNTETNVLFIFLQL